MSGKPKIHQYKTLSRLASRIRDDLKDHDFVLLFAFINLKAMADDTKTLFKKIYATFIERYRFELPEIAPQ